MTLRIVDIEKSPVETASAELLRKAEGVHRQLRPSLPDDYAEKMWRVIAGGARMCVAMEGDAVVGVAVYRVFENTADGLRLYVDDLVTDEVCRSRGVGSALFAHIEALARTMKCENLILDSGTHRQQAHKFYFREGMVITSFNFKKPLK